jgi:hypothetical protein
MTKEPTKSETMAKLLPERLAKIREDSAPVYDVVKSKADRLAEASKSTRRKSADD